MKIKNYIIENSWLTSPSGEATKIVFYYSREETKRYHENNLLHGYSLINQMSGKYKQLIGLDYELNDKAVYTKIINAYIKGEI